MLRARGRWLRSVTRSSIACATLAAAGLSGVRAQDASLHVVLARTGASALVLWNATPFVADIVAKRVDDAAANDVLERGALRAAALEMPSLRNAKTIDVRILYDKRGDVSPVYGSETFAGVERYAVVRLDAAKARADADRWRELDPHHPIPAWISYRLVGSLPPR